MRLHTVCAIINVFDEPLLTRRYLALAGAEGFEASASDTVEAKLAEVALCREIVPVDFGFEIMRVGS